MYLANMAPVITKGVFKNLAKPIDFGKKINGKEILGSHKTFRGLLFGVVFGILTALIQFLLYRYEAFNKVSIFDYGLMSSIILGALMGFGAVFGDMVKSFFKRRVKIEPGKPWIPFDQIDFVIGGLLLSFIIFIPPIPYIVMIIVVSPLGHIAVNHLAFYLKIRKEKW